MKSLLERKEDILLLIAYASLLFKRQLLFNNESTDSNNLQAEKSRIERIAESFYKSAKDREYNQFIIDWVKDNSDDLVYTDRFCYDENIPDEQYDLNPDFFSRKA